MNPNIERLSLYPFERLAALLSGIAAPRNRSPIALSIGEPRHAPPAFIVEAATQYAGDLASYPSVRGLPELRAAMANWLRHRYGLADGSLDPESHVLPVCGTREGLFSFVQAMVDASRAPCVVMPNPCYQIYEGAALLAGATPWFLGAAIPQQSNSPLAAVPEEIWKRCQILFLCSPGNPTGAVHIAADYILAFELADRYDFVVAVDECYADIYSNEAAPPVGALEVAAKAGRPDFARLVVFHSLSKRSSVPGLRSGLVAGDAGLIRSLAAYRTYHGCAMPVATQKASVGAWSEDRHVAANRARYQKKFSAAARVLAPTMPVEIPPGAFYLWLKVPGGDDERFTRELYAREGLVILPGRYLSRATPAGDPGVGYVRISLVPEEALCDEAMTRLARFVSNYGP